MRTVVIVGGGQAGFQTAASLRQKKFGGRIVVVGDEPGMPYQRPPLSKAYLTGGLPDDRLSLRSMHFYQKHEIELITARAVAIDRARHVLALADGRELTYGHLVLATGARNRTLPVPGCDLAGVVGLRTKDDADLLRDRLTTASNTVVIGGGFIGLEFAASAAKLGLPVSVVEQSDRLLGRAVSPAISQYVRTLHQRNGNRVYSRTNVTALWGDTAGNVTAVELAGGTVLPADLVVVGIGVVPETGLAEAAGLPVDDGVVVDETLCTPDEDISAIGDCARFPSRHTGAPLRLESVQNAVDHARCLAARLTGTAEPYRAFPWFWSDQFGMKLQIAGLSAGYDEAFVHGDPGRGALSVFCFCRGWLVAVESINRAPDHAAARRLLASDTQLTRHHLSGEFDLRHHFRQHFTQVA